MIWIILILVLLIALVYFTGNFITHQTTICLTEVDREIEQCFAFACQPALWTGNISGIHAIELQNDVVKRVGDNGKIKTNQGVFPFEIIDFVPNYRVAAVSITDHSRRKIQLSFYKLSRTKTRVVWIDRVESSSNFNRVWMALRKKQSEKHIQQMLDSARLQLENMEEKLTPYADVSPEENPNFTLK